MRLRPNSLLIHAKNKERAPDAPPEIRRLRVRRPLLRLGDLVDGEHFFETLTDDAVYEVLYDVPGWPRVIEGRTALMAAFRGYVDNIALRSADKLIVHKADNGAVVAIEHEVHGKILANGANYDNRFCSILRI